MDQLHLLILLSISMLVGSFLSGTVPMAVKLSESKSRLLALMGSGILVGTALAIIIPEGIDSIYSKQDPLPHQNQDLLSNSSNDHHVSMQAIPQEPVQLWIIGVSLVAGFVLMLLIDQFSIYQAGGQSSDHHHHSSVSSSSYHYHNSRHEYSLAPEEDDEDDNINEIDTSANKEQNANNQDSPSETKPIRVTIRNLDNQSETNHRYLEDSGHAINSNRNINRATPTLGLVIHASADGIALGAAATTSHRDVEMIIFLAIMLHKAPAAFSLVVFLIHRGLKHSTIRRHLLAFSLSAPLAALITYFGLSQSGKESLRRNNATGIAMLFSAGTFLYVATVHVLPELVHNKLLSRKELLFLVGGSFLPILLAQLI